MKDRLVAGGLAGAVAGLIQYGFGLITEALGYTNKNFALRPCFSLSPETS